MRIHRLWMASLVAVTCATPLYAQRGESRPPADLPTDLPMQIPTRRTVDIPPPPVPEGSPVHTEPRIPATDFQRIPGVIGEEPAKPPAPQWMINPRIDFAYLPKWSQRDNAAISEVDISAPMRIPLGMDWLPELRINPVVAQRFWDGPNTAGFIPPHDVPGALYEFYSDFRIRPRLAEWFFLDLRFTPGFYTDMQNTTTDSWMPRGYAMGVFAFSEQFQFLIGVAATNRVLSQMVPIGGFQWYPNEDTEVRLVFPVPRLAVCIDKDLLTNTKYWLHLTGEWGGGAWGVQRANGLNDKLDYSDARLYAGIESQKDQIVQWHAEFGIVFDRRLTYRSNAPEEYLLGATFVARVGFSY